jgi:hypothetical protein
MLQKAARIKRSEEKGGIGEEEKKYVKKFFSSSSPFLPSSFRLTSFFTDRN